ncbi:hypothetical protein BSKO_12866 [Bryopsis sp. KO-2023]|nr:hypothetical protein BSKO_12866 [Bryopsis sp. KO-2023]
MGLSKQTNRLQEQHPGNGLHLGLHDTACFRRLPRSLHVLHPPPLPQPPPSFLKNLVEVFSLRRTRLAHKKRPGALAPTRHGRRGPRRGRGRGRGGGSGGGSARGRGAAARGRGRGARGRSQGAAAAPLAAAPASSSAGAGVDGGAAVEASARAAQFSSPDANRGAGWVSQSRRVRWRRRSEGPKRPKRKPRTTSPIGFSTVPRWASSPWIGRGAHQVSQYGKKKGTDEATDERKNGIERLNEQAMEVPQPLNERAANIMFEHVDLLDSSRIEPLLLQLVAHVAAYKVILSRPKKGNCAVGLERSIPRLDAPKRFQPCYIVPSDEGHLLDLAFNVYCKKESQLGEPLHGTATFQAAVSEAPKCARNWVGKIFFRQFCLDGFHRFVNNILKFFFLIRLRPSLKIPVELISLSRINQTFFTSIMENACDIMHFRIISHK